MTISDIARFVFICLEVVLLFNLLIFVHELGHFLAAKWRGLYIEEFALWFGKPIWRKKIGGVWYALNSIPAGGYVKLPQMAPMESIEGGSEELPAEAKQPISPMNKIIVAFAGPLFSFLLALAMATVVWAVGKPESDADRPIIGEVSKGGPADVAGLKAGDVILEVDGKKVTHFASGTDSVTWAIIRSEGEKIPFVVQRGEQVLTIYSGWEKRQNEGSMRPGLRKVLISNRAVPSVGFVQPRSIAAKAGFQAGDIVVSAAGTPVFDLGDLADLIRANFDQPIAMEVERPGGRVSLTVQVPKPKSEKAPIELGIEWGMLTMRHPTPWRQVADAATSIFRMVGALFSNSGVQVAHFSGPVGIMNIYYRVFEHPEGWRLAFALSVLINVNLAMINMLPFPVLDGGHITLALIEAVRRKPVNVRVLEWVQTACAVLIIGFMLYVTFYDVGDIIGGRRADKAAEKENAPPPEPPK